MKILILVLFSLSSLSLSAMDPTTYLNLVDNKVYSLKSKGVKDFVVDVQSSRLLKQVNDQMVFGKIPSLVFRTYWTGNPERLAIEVIGLPEGFKEIKEELKASVLSLLDSLIPLPTASRFAGYKISEGKNAKELIATDTTGIAPVPAFELMYDDQDRLKEVVGKKPIGSLNTVLAYEKIIGLEGKWGLASSITTSSENGYIMMVKKKLTYSETQGIPVLSSISITSEQKQDGPKAKPLISSETLEFKNYRINNGEALKYFLGEQSKSEP